MAIPYYMGQPPKTARVSRKIWDQLTEYLGHEPMVLWRNWNGIVFGQHQGDAWYGQWFYAADHMGELGEFVPLPFQTKAGVTNPLGDAKIDKHYCRYRGE